MKIIKLIIGTLLGALALINFIGMVMAISQGAPRQAITTMLIGIIIGASISIWCFCTLSNNKKN